MPYMLEINPLSYTYIEIFIAMIFLLLMCY